MVPPASAIIAILAIAGASAQTLRTPSARLVSASRLALPGEVDSNNPAVWSLVDGLQRLFVFSSWGGIPTRAAGGAIDALARDGGVTFTAHPGHGVWIEAIVPDHDADTWYGYYHHERPAELCGRHDRQLPRIGALRSRDRGETWDDLGIVLDAPPGSEACNSQNRFVLGGVGDVTAAADPDTRDIYLYFSQYTRDAASQGVVAARLAWADRDEPAGKLSIWSDGVWLPEGQPTSLWVTRQPFHDRTTASDVFWGPSIHWNTYLEQYVMLLNRARDDQFNQDGIYVSFSPTLDDPARWSTPARIMSGGQWYPQVIGLEQGSGTDRLAGKRARFFMTGRSDRLIEFER